MESNKSVSLCTDTSCVCLVKYVCLSMGSKIKAFSALQMILESCSFYFSLAPSILPPKKTNKAAKLVKTIMGPFKFEMFLFYAYLFDVVSFKISFLLKGAPLCYSQISDTIEFKGFLNMMKKLS